jgi:hypothetical protein
MRKKSRKPAGKVDRRKPKAPHGPYGELLSGVVRLIEQARLAAVRSVNVVLTSTYWLVGQRIVEHEQSGSKRAVYGEALLKLLAQDLTARLGRGFSERNIRQMRLFYLGWPIRQTVSAKLDRREFGRHCLPNLSHGRSSLCLGHTMSGCCPSRMPRHGNIMSVTHCLAAGQPVNSIGRSPVLPTREPEVQDRGRPTRRLCPLRRT